MKILDKIKLFYIMFLHDEAHFLKGKNLQNRPKFSLAPFHLNFIFPSIFQNNFPNIRCI